MSTYRVYVLNTTNAVKPTVEVAYISADKYGPAWGAARSLLNDGKPHKDSPAIKQMFAEPELKTAIPAAWKGDNFTVAKIVDIKPRNVKVDKAKLQELVNSSEGTAEQRLAALKLALGA